MATGNELLVLQEHKNSLRGIAWHPDGRQIATGGHDKLMIIWDADSGAVIERILGQGHENVSSVDWDAAGKYVAYLSPANLKVWENASNRSVIDESFVFVGTSSVQFSPDSRRLAVTMGHDLVLYDLDTPTRRDTLRGHFANVRDAVWSPDGSRLASSSFDGTVRIWHTELGQEIITFEHPDSYFTSVTWSPDGRAIACGTADGQLQIRDALKGYELVNDSSLLNAQVLRQLEDVRELARQKNLPEAVTVLSAMLAWKPDSTELLSERATIYARMQQWKLAAGDFARICELEPGSPWPRCAEAMLSLQYQDIDRYLACCERLLDIASESRDNARIAAAWTCLLEPDTAQRFPSAAELIAAEYEAAKDNPDLKFLVQVVDSRRGNPEAKFTPKLEADAPLSHAVECAWEAIRLLELNRQTEARAYYDQARAQLDSGRGNILGEDWWPIVVGDILLREIEGRLESTGDR